MVATRHQVRVSGAVLLPGRGPRRLRSPRRRPGTPRPVVHFHHTGRMHNRNLHLHCYGYGVLAPTAKVYYRDADSPREQLITGARALARVQAYFDRQDRWTTTATILPSASNNEIACFFQNEPLPVMFLCRP